MEISINLDSDKRKNKYDGLESISKEFENSLSNKSRSIYEQLLEDHELASKYKGKLKGFIKEGMKDVSRDYDENFKYIEYNSKSNNYYIYDFSQGNFKRTKTTLKELKKSNLSIGNIYSINKNNQLERDFAIEYQVKDDVNYALWNLEDW